MANMVKSKAVIVVVALLRRWGEGCIKDTIRSCSSYYQTQMGILTADGRCVLYSNL